MSEHVFHFFTGSLTTCIAFLLMMLALCYKGRVVAFAFPLFFFVSSISVVYYYGEGLPYPVGYNLYRVFLLSFLLLSFMCIFRIKKIEKHQNFNEWIKKPFELLSGAAFVLTIDCIYSFNSDGLIDYPIIGFILFYCIILFVKTIIENQIKKVEV